MKKHLLTIMILICPISTINAQYWSGLTSGNIYYNLGWVGIGTDLISSPLTISTPTSHLIPTVNVLHISANPGCDGCINIGQKIAVTDNQGTWKSNIGLWIDARNAANNYAAIFENGNVGIGTTSPSAKLHIENGPNSDAAILATSSEYNKLVVSSGVTYPVNVMTFKITQQFGDNRNNGYISFHRGNSVDGGFLSFGTYGTERIRIDTYGNVGIGTASPSYKLTLANIKTDNSNNVLAYFGSSGSYGGSVAIGIGFHSTNYLETNSGYTVAGLRMGSSYSDFNIINGVTGGTYGAINFYTNDTHRIKIGADGNVLIGKTTQTNSAYKLDVNGKIRTDEVVVNATGADFVFEPDYNLPELHEIEKYITEYKHLPDLPPTSEMKENGLNVSEMQTVLLQKIEEITLYVIEQNKRLERQNFRIQILENELKTIKTALDH